MMSSPNSSAISSSFFYNVLPVPPEKCKGISIIDKAGKPAVRPMLGAIRKTTGKPFETFQTAVTAEA
jgi:hypothetical protein